jgi:hypothetical protein
MPPRCSAGGIFSVALSVTEPHCAELSSTPPTYVGNPALQRSLRGRPLALPGALPFTPSPRRGTRGVRHRLLRAYDDGVRTFLPPRLLEASDHPARPPLLLYPDFPRVPSVRRKPPIFSRGAGLFSAGGSPRPLVGGAAPLGAAEMPRTKMGFSPLKKASRTWHAPITASTIPIRMPKSKSKPPTIFYALLVVFSFVGILLILFPRRPRPIIPNICPIDGQVAERSKRQGQRDCEYSHFSTVEKTTHTWQAACP